MSDEILLERLLDESYPGYAESEKQIKEIQEKIKSRIDRFDELKNGDRLRRSRESDPGTERDGPSGAFFDGPKEGPAGAGNTGTDLFAEYGRPAVSGAFPETDEDDALFGSFTDVFGGRYGGNERLSRDGSGASRTRGIHDENDTEEYSLFDTLKVFPGDEETENGHEGSDETPADTEEDHGRHEEYEGDFSGNTSSLPVIPSGEAFSQGNVSVTPSGEAFTGIPVPETVSSKDTFDTSRTPASAKALTAPYQNTQGDAPRTVTEGAFEKQNGRETGRANDRRSIDISLGEDAPQKEKNDDPFVKIGGRDNNVPRGDPTGNGYDKTRGNGSETPSDRMKNAPSGPETIRQNRDVKKLPDKPSDTQNTGNDDEPGSGAHRNEDAADQTPHPKIPEEKPRETAVLRSSAAVPKPAAAAPAFAGAERRPAGIDRERGAYGTNASAKAEDKPKQNVIRVKKNRKYQFPPLELVRPRDREEHAGDNEDLYTLEAERNAEKLNTTLRNFGIGVRITGITRGPAVTRFEFKPDEGIKISRIVALTNDIALSLAASAVRMEAPIPGKPAIGIEIPNKTASTVYIHDVLNTTEYKTAKSKLTVALGKDIDGHTVLADLNKMPHLLIAGSTGSGKSVCINTLIMGILFGAAPDEVRFIMIDPKVVELGIYNNIPHLLIPVVTEPKKASAALAWAVAEVERRYILFAENNVRDLANYNRGIKEKPEMAKLEKLPQIVIIIDELADLMMAAPQDVERSVIRLAQKARAAGVHLVIATQRPSVDVITGIIKANIPSRIAFAVASQIDSRTILDTIGAEKLLGRGDMLYHPLGFTKSVRVQCAFVSDEEVERVVSFIRNSYGAPEFDDEVTEAITAAAEQSQKEKGQSRDNDPAGDDADQDRRLIREAAELALSQGCISTSSLQRRMRLGYGRAARVIDSLETMGLLSGSDGSKPRQVLMTKDQWKKRLEEEDA